MAIYIKRGFGFNVGQDFARAQTDLVVNEPKSDRGFIYGYIVGDPQSSLGFLRSPKVSVRVRQDATINQVLG
jgi:hypothetical protein